MIQFKLCKSRQALVQFALLALLIGAGAAWAGDQTSHVGDKPKTFVQWIETSGTVLNKKACCGITDQGELWCQTMPDFILGTLCNWMGDVDGYRLTPEGYKSVVTKPIDNEVKSKRYELPDHTPFVSLAGNRTNSLTAGDVCALNKDNKIYCFNPFGHPFGKYRGSPTEVPVFGYPSETGEITDLFGNGDVFCVLTSLQAVYCWGRSEYYASNFDIHREMPGRRMLPKLPADYPTRIDLPPVKWVDFDRDALCFLTLDDRPICFGTEYQAGNNQPVYPSGADVLSRYRSAQERGRGFFWPTGSFELNRLEASLSALSAQVYPFKAKYLNKIEAALKTVPTVGNDFNLSNLRALQVRLWTLFALEPFVLDLTSDRLSESAVPAYQSALQAARAKHGIRGLSEIESSPPVREMALKVLGAALSSLESQLSSKPAVAEMKQALGVALASDFSREALRPCLETFSKNRELISSWAGSPRTKGLGMTVQLAVEYLSK